MAEFMVDPKEGLSKWQEVYCQAYFGQIPHTATVYNGRKMNIGWAAILEDAQNVTERIINNEVFPRIRFAEEPTPSADSHCSECLAGRHTHHCPGCRSELCMNCRKSGENCKCDIGYFDGSG